MKIFFLAVCILLQQPGINMLSFDAKQIPSSRILGKIKQGMRWTDKDGEHVVVLTETGSRAAGSLSEAKLYAYHFIKSDTGLAQVWRVIDGVPPCEVDIVCEHVKNSLSVTDLDKDGTAEVSFVYLLACQGGVDPATKKLIMYEGSTKYAIRGLNILTMGKEKIGGERTVDKQFGTAPASLRVYAEKQFDKFGNTAY